MADLPGVVVARELTVWGFGDQSFQLTLATAEGRVRADEQAGRILYWVMLPFVILGLAVLARNARKSFVVLAMPVVVVAVNAAVFYGSTRMRMAAEPSLAVLGALGLVAVADVVRSLDLWFLRRGGGKWWRSPPGAAHRPAALSCSASWAR